MGATRRRDRLHLRRRQRRRRDALRDAHRPHPREAEDAVRGGARACDPDRRERRAPTARAIPMILATGARAHASVRQQLRTFTLAQRALGRVPRRALFRGADRRRRDHGQRLSGAGGDRRPPCRGLFGELSARATASNAIKKAIDDGPAQDHVEDGHRGDLVLSRRLQFRGGRACRARWSPILPRHASRISGIGLAGIQREGAASCTRAPGREDVIALPIGGFYRYRRGGETPCLAATLIHTLQTRGRHRRLLRPSSTTREAMREAAAGRSCATCSISAPRPSRDLDRRGRDRSPRSASASSRPACRWARLSPEAHGTLNIAMNRIGAKSDSGEGGEDPRALQAAAERRQRQLGDQADRLGPLRRHRRVSQSMPRDRDQGRAGRQARRRRPAARLQGHRADRASCATRRPASR